MEDLIRSSAGLPSVNSSTQQQMKLKADFLPMAATCTNVWPDLSVL
jgi:hypothetical protein